MDFTSLMEGQPPFIALMGVIIMALIYVYFLQRKELKGERKEKQSLAEKVVKVGTLWEIKSSLNSDEHKEIADLIHQLTKDVANINKR